MQQSTRLIVNALSMFARIVVTLVIGIIVVRLIINTLGIEDYGLLTVLGGSAAMFTVFASVLTGGAQRHLAFEVGRSDRHQLQVVFNTALVLFMVLALLVVVIGAAIAPWLLSILNIPQGREAAAFWVYHIVLIGMVFNVALTPFRAMIIAHETMYLLDGFAVLSTLLGLAVAVVLLVVPGDKLIIYAAMMLPVQCLLPSVATVLCLVRYSESRPRLSLFCRSQFRRIASFAGWLTIHRLGQQLRLQGGLIVINVFFEAKLNASYALAVLFAGYRRALAQAVLRGVAPAMAGMVARADTTSLQRLTLVANKYAAVGTFYLVVPTILEADLILRLWLGEAPAGAALFIRLVLTWMSIKVLTRGYDMAAVALGNLAGFVLPVTALTFGTLLLSIAWFSVFHLEAWTLPATAIGMNVVIDLYIAGYVGRRLGLTYRDWIRSSVFPSLFVLAVAGGPAWWIRTAMPANWPRLLCVFLVYGLLATVAMWKAGMKDWEQQHIRRVFSQGVTHALAKAGLRQTRS